MEMKGCVADGLISSLQELIHSRDYHLRSRSVWVQITERKKKKHVLVTCFVSGT